MLLIACWNTLVLSFILSSEWRSLEAESDRNPLPGCSQLTPFVMLIDLILLWQEMMSLDHRNVKSWLFDSTFSSMQLYFADTPAVLDLSSTYFHIIILIPHLQMMCLSCGFPSCWLKPEVKSIEIKEAKFKKRKCWTILCFLCLNHVQRPSFVIHSCSCIPYYPKTHRG